MHLSLKCDIWWQYFNDFPDNQLIKFRVFIGWSRIFILSPLNFYETSRFVPRIGWTPLTDTTAKQANKKQTSLCKFVCLCLRWSLTLTELLLFPLFHLSYEIFCEFRSRRRVGIFHCNDNTQFVVQFYC